MLPLDKNTKNCMVCCSWAGRTSMKRWMLRFMILVVVIIIGFILSSDTFLKPSPQLSIMAWNGRFPGNEELGVCRLPKLNPFDSSVQDLIFEPKAAMCETGDYRLMFDTDRKSTLILVQDPSKYGWRDCCYSEVIRKDYDEKTNQDPDNEQRIESKCHPIRNTRTLIPERMEFIAVFCTRIKSGNSSMVDVFAFVPLKPKVEERIINYEKKDGNSNSARKERRVNLVVLGIDSLSHMNLMRSMPQVYEYLVNNLSSIGMNGYTKIGESTHPNLQAILTSLNPQEFADRCVDDEFIENCPLLWQVFSQEGYRTVYGEDVSDAAIFNYGLYGFKKPPVDYYLRTLTNVAYSFIKNDKRGTYYLCYGPKLTLQYILKYMEKSAQLMGMEKRYFQLLFAACLTHEFVNEAKLGGDHVLSTLQWFQDTGYFNNTVLVLLSDHGMRYGEFRERTQGRYENNMPFIYFTFPSWFRKRYSSAIKNMMANKDRLTTPYDTHETFLDILYLDNISEDRLRFREQALVNLNHDIPRGISMFLPIPKFRNCEMAEIPEEHCVCHTSKNISTTDPAAIQGVNYAIKVLNSYLANYTGCANLSLSEIRRVETVDRENFDITEDRKMFTVTFLTEPSKALFEVTVMKDSKDVWSLSGTFSRINRYGNQSHCVSGREIEKICYCL